jgi:membrane protein DedA with SNARE-associated domain
MIPWDDILSYVFVFGALVISAFGAPIPEEIPIVGAGVLVGKQWNNPDSWLVWWAMLPVCIAGVVVCDAILYFIGRRWGTKLLKRRWVQKRILPPEKKEKIEKNFHEYGIAILLGARFLPGFRTPIFAMAGVMRLPFRKFLLADGLYAIPGVNLLFWLAYWFTDQFARAFEKVEGNRPIVVAVILAAVSGFIVYQYFIKRRVTTGDPKDFPVIGEKLAERLQSSHLRAEEYAHGVDGQPYSTDQRNAVRGFWLVLLCRLRRLFWRKKDESKIEPGNRSTSAPSELTEGRNPKKDEPESKKDESKVELGNGSTSATPEPTEDQKPGVKGPS